MSNQPALPGSSQCRTVLGELGPTEPVQKEGTGHAHRGGGMATLELILAC